MQIDIPAGVAKILSRLHDCGYEAYIVGGCVRDRLLATAPKDYDVCTSALPDQMKDCFTAPFKTYETGIAHGTLTVVCDGQSVECTTFRLDGEYLDGRHPDAVSFTDKLANDLCRRDFTINAMAMDGQGDTVDLFGGRQDLQARIIRAVGQPEKRFSEDALRILRALRFASRLDFTIEEQTASALRTLAPKLGLISRERIAAELFGIVCGMAAGRITRDYRDVIACAIPDPAEVSDDLPQDQIIRMAALCVNDARQVDTLKLSNKQRDAIKTLIENKDRALPADHTQALMLLRDIGYDNAVRLCLFRSDEDARMQVQSAHKSGVPYLIHDLAVNGSHLQALGYSGENIRAALLRALDAVIRGDIENKKDAIISYLS